MDYKHIRNKSIGIFCNQTAVNRNDNHILDLIGKDKSIDVKAIFEPEYGIWGVDDSRAKLSGGNRIDPISGAKIFNLLKRSLYPPDWILKELDLIVIDIQDTGSRYSTFIASITKLFESASRHKIPILVLDRPNPIGGLKIEGPLPRTSYQSFEAYHLLPIRHGMTIGEILLMVNEMGWAKDLLRVDLNIIPAVNWGRSQYLNDTKLPWKNPTPFINNIDALIMYSGMDLMRGTNLNIGIGTDHPYLIFGAPWLATGFFKEKLDMLELPGVRFEEIEYKPQGNIYNKIIPKYINRFCSGIKIIVEDKYVVKPVEVATTIITLIERLHPREFQWAPHGYLDKLYGSNQLRLFVAQKKPPSYLSPQYMHDEIEFSKFRKKFLLY